MTTNFNNVLKVYGLMRNFSPDDEALLATLRGLSDVDRERLIELLGPAKRATKKPANKTVSKSRRASLAGAMRDSIKVHIEDHACRFKGDDGMYCGLPEVSPIHDKSFGYAGYHEFVPPATTAKDDNYEEQAAGAGGD